MGFKFVDLFAGLGGFHLASSKLGGECVFACEINEKLRHVYSKNFDIDIYGDIRSIEPKNIPSHDLLCAGFPCQPFSKAGSQLGWKDTVRGTVFFNIIKILEFHKPQFIILENVAHFVNHDSGNTYQKVKTALESLGYNIINTTLSPHQFGIPQIRERMYLVGNLKSLDYFNWPEPISERNSVSIYSILDETPKNARNITQQVENCLNVWQNFLDIFPKHHKLPSFPIWSMEFGATYPYTQDSLHKLNVRELKKYKGVFGDSLNLKTKNQIFSKLPSYALRKSRSFPKWKQNFIRQNRDLYLQYKDKIDEWINQIKKFPPSLQKFEWNCQGEERNIWKHIIQFRASGVRIKRATTSPSLVAMTSTQVPIIGKEKRYMSINECARLQCLDKLEHLPDSSNATMSALGNAVNVEVVINILKNLLLPVL